MTLRKKRLGLSEPTHYLIWQKRLIARILLLLKSIEVSGYPIDSTSHYRLLLGVQKVLEFKKSLPPTMLFVWLRIYLHRLFQQPVKQLTA